MEPHCISLSHRPLRLASGSAGSAPHRWKTGKPHSRCESEVAQNQNSKIGLPSSGYLPWHFNSQNLPFLRGHELFGLFRKPPTTMAPTKNAQGYEAASGTIPSLTLRLGGKFNPALCLQESLGHQGRRRITIIYANPKNLHGMRNY